MKHNHSKVEHQERAWDPKCLDWNYDGLSEHHIQFFSVVISFLLDGTVFCAFVAGSSCSHASFESQSSSRSILRSPLGFPNIRPKTCNSQKLVAVHIIRVFTTKQFYISRISIRVITNIIRKKDCYFSTLNRILIHVIHHIKNFMKLVTTMRSNKSYKQILLY